MDSDGRLELADPKTLPRRGDGVTEAWTEGPDWRSEKSRSTAGQLGG